MIIYYQMDATWSVGLVWTYFANLNYLVVQNWVKSTFLFPDTINQMGPNVYHYVKFFPERVGYMPLDTPCDCIVAIIYHTDDAISFVITTFPAL